MLVTVEETILEDDVDGAAVAELDVLTTWHDVPRAETSLKLSANDPLDTPYFAPVIEEIAMLPV